jgi:hypothetical protein
MREIARSTEHDPPITLVELAKVESADFSLRRGEIARLVQLGEKLLNCLESQRRFAGCSGRVRAPWPFRALE